MLIGVLGGRRYRGADECLAGCEARAERSSLKRDGSAVVKVASQPLTPATTTITTVAEIRFAHHLR
jgi:hypothetical protein